MCQPLYFYLDLKKGERKGRWGEFSKYKKQPWKAERRTPGSEKSRHAAHCQRHGFSKLGILSCTASHCTPGVTWPSWQCPGEVSSGLCRNTQPVWLCCTERSNCSLSLTQVCVFLGLDPEQRSLQRKEPRARKSSSKHAVTLQMGYTRLRLSA